VPHVVFAVGEAPCLSAFRHPIAVGARAIVTTGAGFGVVALALTATKARSSAMVGSIGRATASMPAAPTTWALRQRPNHHRGRLSGTSVVLARTYS